MSQFNEQDFHANVRKLFVKPDDVIGRTLHAAVGISGEAGELLDMVKKTWIYNKPLDHENLIEECGDLMFYIAAILDQHGYTIGQAADHNYAKLSKRYPQGYSDSAARDRADKVSA